MDNVIDFPTPREQAGVSMAEDMDNLFDGLMGAMLALKHSENVPESDRKADMEVMMPLILKYFNLAGERYGEPESE